MGIQGFPTLKIVKPGPKSGKPMVEDYQGQRTAKAIVDTMVEKIPNHIKRLQDSSLESWLEEDAGSPKAMLFTEKGTVSALLRSLGVDYLGTIKFGQIRSKETASVEKFGVTQFPSLVLVSGASQVPLIYSGEMKKAPMLQFLSQVASPNPDPAPKKSKSSSSSQSKPTSSASTKPAASQKPVKPPIEVEDFQEIVLDDDTPLESPIPIIDTEQPAAVPELVPAIPMLSTAPDLESVCLTPKSGICLLVLLPTGSGPDTILPESAASALTSLAEVAYKHSKRKAKIFPFYSIPGENEASKTIRNDLGLKPEIELEIICINMKRRWWRLYASDDVDFNTLESFVDSIRLSEGAKTPLPGSFYPGEQPPGPEPVVTPELDDEEASSSSAEPEPVAEPTAESEPRHNEL